MGIDKINNQPNIPADTASKLPKAVRTKIDEQMFGQNAVNYKIEHSTFNSGDSTCTEQKTSIFKNGQLIRENTGYRNCEQNK